MKLLKFFILGLFLLNLSIVPAFAQAGKGKIGFVDLSRLFDEYHKTKAYDKVLEAEHSEFEKQRNEKVEKVREAQGKLGLLKNEEKAKVEEDIEKLKADLLEFTKENQTDLTKKRNEKIREILLEIEKIVSDFAEKEGYSIILNDRVLIYGNSADDLTAKMLEILNKSQQQ